MDIENIIEEKEEKVKKDFRKKLRRYRKELENEKKINSSLTKRIQLLNIQDYSISDIDLNREGIILHSNDQKQSKSQLEYHKYPSQLEEDQISEESYEKKRRKSSQPQISQSRFLSCKIIELLTFR